MFLNVLFATLIILAHVNGRTSPQGANAIRTIAWSLFAMRGTKVSRPNSRGHDDQRGARDRDDGRELQRRERRPRFQTTVATGRNALKRKAAPGVDGMTWHGTSNPESRICVDGSTGEPIDRNRRVGRTYRRPMGSCGRSRSPPWKTRSYRAQPEQDPIRGTTGGRICNLACPCPSRIKPLLG